MKLRSLFNPESWLWKPLGVLGDLVMLSLLWTVFSVPILTFGSASAALYDTAVHSIRRREDTVVARFLSTFKRELKQGIFSTVIVLGVSVLLFFAPLLVFTGQTDWPYLIALWVLLAFFLLCFLCWLWPVLSRFSMGFRALHVNALRLSFGYILRSAAMAVVWGLTLYAGLRFIAPLFVCPALASLLSSTLIEPVFGRYEEQSTPLDESGKV